MVLASYAASLEQVLYLSQLQLIPQRDSGSILAK